MRPARGAVTSGADDDGGGSGGVARCIGGGTNPRVPSCSTIDAAATEDSPVLLRSRVVGSTERRHMPELPAV